jgi:CNP1-like family
MNIPDPGRATHRICRLAALVLFFSPVISADDDTGSFRIPFIEAPAWKEEASGLPAYPENDRLLEVPASVPGYDFRVFIDPDSLSVGGDGVVRYTLVIVSSSGVRNISYEGLHCGSHEYRRYAYGSEDKWFPIEAAPWQKVSDTGMDHYRYVLYWNYLCSPMRTNLDASAMLRRLRNPPGTVLHD